MTELNRKEDGKVSRRAFIGSAGVAAAGSAWLPPKHTNAKEAADVDKEVVGAHRFSKSGQSITLHINGADARVDVTPDMTLLNVLRESRGLTGAKEVCDRGACGACTVLVDGRSVNSCMMLAIDAIGSSITTVEGLGEQGRLDPVQQAFVENDACQCGFCIPGFVVRSRAFLDETPRPNLDEIKHGLSGNICRCAAYAAIFAAVEDASQGGKP